MRDPVPLQPQPRQGMCDQEDALCPSSLGNLHRAKSQIFRKSSWALKAEARWALRCPHHPFTSVVLLRDTQDHPPPLEGTLAWRDQGPVSLGPPPFPFPGTSAGHRWMD